MAIDPYKARIIELALSAAAAHGFALAGGNALVAHGLLSRPTQDIDLFSPTAQGSANVLHAVQAILTEHGYDVHLVRAAEDGDFAELHVSRDDQTTQLDLGRDWRAHDAVTLDLGPVLHLDDAVGAKTTALLGRALPRDFIDVAATLQRYTRRQLLELAHIRDPGLRAADAALAAHRLDHIEDKQFRPYGLAPTDIQALRACFADWPRDPSADADAAAAHRHARGLRHP